MPSQKNQDQVKNLKTKLKQAKSVLLADYAGLPVNLQQELRAQVIEAGGELIVAKNTLLKIAAQELNYPIKTLTDSFTGPTITLFAYEDEIAPIKALAEFTKKYKLPTIKAGFLDKEPLTKEQAKTLSELPTKIELIAKTVGSLKSPLTGFVNVLSGNLRNLIFALKAIKTKKGGE